MRCSITSASDAIERPIMTNPMAPLTMAQRLTAEELEAGAEAEV